MLSLQFLAYFVMIPWRMMSPIRENNLKLNTKTITLKRKSFNTNITKHQTLHECIYKCIYFVYETLWLKCNILFTTNNFILTQITSYFLDTTRILNYNKDNDLITDIITGLSFMHGLVPYYHNKTTLFIFDKTLANMLKILIITPMTLCSFSIILSDEVSS